MKQLTFALQVCTEVGRTDHLSCSSFNSQTHGQELRPTSLVSPVIKELEGTDYLSQTRHPQHINQGPIIFIVLLRFIPTFLPQRGSKAIQDTAFGLAWSALQRGNTAEKPTRVHGFDSSCETPFPTGFKHLFPLQATVIYNIEPTCLLYTAEALH